MPRPHARTVTVASTDNSRAVFQAAVDELDDGTTIAGRLVLEQGVSFNSAVEIGDGTKDVFLEISGAPALYYEGHEGRGPLTRVQQLNPAADTFTINSREGGTVLVDFKGLQFEYPALATGIGVKFVGLAVGATFNKCRFRNMYTGVYFDKTFGNFAAQNVEFYRTSWSEGIGPQVVFDGSATLPLFYRCFWDSGATAVWVKDGTVQNADFQHCTWQEGTDVVFDLDGNLDEPTFVSPWFESNSTYIFELKGDMNRAHFTNPQVSHTAKTFAYANGGTAEQWRFALGKLRCANLTEAATGTPFTGVTIDGSNLGGTADTDATIGGQA